MYYNQRDLDNELFILSSIKDIIPLLKGYDWTQSKKPEATFDFRGYYDGKLAAALDVKVRDISPNTYPNYFISENKVQTVMDYPQYNYFVVYYFESAKIARVYHLNHMDLSPQELHFRHKRANQQMNKQVYLVSAKDHCGEAHFE